MASGFSVCIQGTVLCSAPPANWYRVGATLKSTLCSSQESKLGCSLIKCVRHCSVLLCCVSVGRPCPWGTGGGIISFVAQSVSCHSLDPPDVARVLKSPSQCCPAQRSDVSASEGVRLALADQSRCCPEGDCGEEKGRQGEL